MPDPRNTTPQQPQQGDKRVNPEGEAVDPAIADANVESDSEKAARKEHEGQKK